MINRALTNTGWTIGVCDTFYEQDGVTEKIRSLSSNGKKGSYQLISDICDIFNAYPIYHGDTKTVDIRALENKLPIAELYVGKNLDSLTIESNSDNIVTRLYVEGRYSDHGYVGIDDVNPTGLPFLLNFDYYEENGLLSNEQKDAIETYLEDRYQNNHSIMARMASILEGENLLNDMWGQISYVVYQLNNRTIDTSKTIYGGTVLDNQKAISENDQLIVFKQTGNYRNVTAGSGGSISFETGDTIAVKFITKPAGKIGAREVAIESKEKMIVNTQNKISELFEITRDPADRYAHTSSSASFQVETNSRNVSYQWWVKRVGHSGWESIGTNNAT